MELPCPDSIGRKALEVWSKKRLGSLFRHLHNDNGSTEFVMGFLDKHSGKVEFKRSKRVPVDRAISWSLATMAGRKGPQQSLAFVPYSTNAQQMSRWGGMDFDAHDGNVARAERLAYAGLEKAVRYDFATILASSGSGGWHLFIIAEGFKPTDFWIQLLKGIASSVGTTIEDGICEIFPPDSLAKGFGKGLRAPGSWNPKTNQLSLIHWQNAENLIGALPEIPTRIARIGEAGKNYSVISPIEKEISLSFRSSLSDWGWLLGDIGRFQIIKKATRHNRLGTLTGWVFHQVTRFVAERLAQLQYFEKTVPTEAALAEHLTEFGEFWDGLHQTWIADLSEAEREKYEMLTTEAERSAFRIIRSYAKKAITDGRSDFPVVRDNLGLRINLTGRAAGDIRRKLTKLGIMELTQAYRANVFPAHFRWIADVPQPF